VGGDYLNPDPPPLFILTFICISFSFLSHAGRRRHSAGADSSESQLGGQGRGRGGGGRGGGGGGGREGREPRKRAEESQNSAFQTLSGRLTADRFIFLRVAGEERLEYFYTQNIQWKPRGAAFRAFYSFMLHTSPFPLVVLRTPPPALCSPGTIMCSRAIGAFQGDSFIQLPGELILVRLYICSQFPTFKVVFYFECFYIYIFLGVFSAVKHVLFTYLLFRFKSAFECCCFSSFQNLISSNLHVYFWFFP